MAQVKIFARREWLAQQRAALSELIHTCLVEALALPPDKRFQRFFALEAEDFIHPADRSERYTILEIHLFEGRSVEVRKQLIRLLIARLSAQLDLHVNDIEITLVETPRANWGVRGLPGDELALNYVVDKA
jgi:phenylpyruvate tautomerase PptA (4-oxalocrotonate tautomerase family)